MYPTLLNLGGFQISTFGVFLALGIFFGGFTVWRIARGYELDSEKILDVSFLTIGAGFLSARLVYVLLNLSSFPSFKTIFFINSYPGLSFWGGLIGGLIALYFLCKKFKMSFLQAGDFAMVGFLLGAFFAEIGCLLGGCGAGIVSNSFFGVPQEGLIGKRIPIQFFEAIVYLIAFLIFWKSVLKFHIEGILFAKGLILLGFIKMISGFFKEHTSEIRLFNFTINVDFLCSLIILIIGLRLYYNVQRKTPITDLKSFSRFFTSSRVRGQVVANFSRRWYNFWVNLRVKAGKGRKKLFKFLNIKPNPENF